MKLAELDQETRAVLVCARIVAKRPTAENLERLERKCVEFEAKHEEERTKNLISALWGPGGIMHEEDDAQA